MGDLFPELLEEPKLSGLGPPSYPDFSDLLEPVFKPPAPHGPPPAYPDVEDASDPDVAQRWIVVKVQGWTPKPKPWAPAHQAPRGVDSKYGMAPADESDRFEEWYGPFSEEDARILIEDMNMVYKIMER